MRPETRDHRWIALYVLCSGMLMIVLDATIVNVALRAIQSDLHFSQSGLAWVVNGYLITFGGLLLLAGRLGDLIGRRRMFLCGLSVFTAASTVCGAALSQETLMAAGFVQGAGGAMTSSVILGMIVTMFNEPREQAKAVGVFAFVASAGGAIGLLVGGVLTQVINWHWIFFVNLPIGVGTAGLVRRLLESGPGIGLTAGADVAGAVLSTGVVMLTVYAIVKPAPLLGVAAGVLAVAFLVRESTAATPLIPLRIFRSRNVSGANLIQALTAAGMFGVFFLGALYVRRVLHYNVLQIGLAFFPVTVLMGTLSVRYTEKLITRFGARPTVRIGIVMIGAAMLWFSRAPHHGSYVIDVLPTMVLLGIGCGVCFPSLMTLARSGATPADAALASALVSMTAQVGGALGLAVLASVASRHAHGSHTLSAIVGGYHITFLIRAILVLAAMAVALIVLKDPAHTADPEAVSDRPGIRPVIHHDQWRADQPRWFPAVFRPPAFASWSSFARLGGRHPSRSAHQPRALTARLDPGGVSTFRTHELRPGWVPSLLRGWWCSPRPEAITGQRLPHHSGLSLDPATTFHLCGVPLDEASTEGSHEFTRLIFPSPVATGWIGSPSAFPRARGGYRSGT
ncbi:MAG: MFS transporter [Solirubrobacteraceae bacterium]